MDGDHVGLRFTDGAPTAQEVHTDVTVTLSNTPLHTRCSEYAVKQSTVCVRVLPADVTLESLSRNQRHVAGQQLVGGQPIGVVVTGGVATGTVGVAEQEGHGGKTR